MAAGWAAEVQVNRDRMVCTVAEAAAMLGIGRTLAYRGIREGWIPSLRLGRKIVVPVAALQELLARAGRAPG